MKLEDINGIGPQRAQKLAAIGVKTVEDVSKLSDAQVEQIDAALSLKGAITREGWRESAAKLLAGNSGSTGTGTTNGTGEQTATGTGTETGTGTGDNASSQAQNAPADAQVPPAPTTAPDPAAAPAPAVPNPATPAAPTSVPQVARTEPPARERRRINQNRPIAKVAGVMEDFPGATQYQDGDYFGADDLQILPS